MRLTILGDICKITGLFIVFPYLRPFLFYKRIWHPDPIRRLFEDISLSSSQSADCLNKVIFLASTPHLLDLLAYHEACRASLDAVTIIHCKGRTVGRDLRITRRHLKACLLRERTRFPRGSVINNLPANAKDVGLIPGLGRSPGEGNGSLLQYFCLENPISREAWWATVHGDPKELSMT